MSATSFRPFAYLVAFATLALFVPSHAHAIQDSNRQDSNRIEIEEIDVDFDEAIEAFIEATGSLSAALEIAFDDYESEMVCPGGEPLLRAREWDPETLRSVPVRPIEDDLRAQCALPEGMPQAELEWWLSPAQQSYACSGPFGEIMSRWGENYDVLQDACVVHDICYRSPMEKNRCDALLEENMMTLCRNPGLGDWLISGLCGIAVDLTSDLFDHDGFVEAYDRGQEEWRRRVGG